MAGKNECTEKVVAGNFTFCLDDGCLLIKIGDDYPCPLSPKTTHQLFNLLFINRADIIAANTEARLYGAEKGNHKGPRGPKKKKKIIV